ncbi:hypothetical protein [Synechococcus sp. M16CYN]
MPLADSHHSQIVLERQVFQTRNSKRTHQVIIALDQTASYPG